MTNPSESVNLALLDDAAYALEQLRHEPAASETVHASCAASVNVDVVRASSAIERESMEWPQPQPLVEAVVPLPYPAESLPPCIREAVNEVCNFVQAPLPLVASSAIAALSLAIQSHVDVKRADRLVGPVGLYLLTIADSGERKSTCDGFFVKAIRDYEAEQADALKPVLTEHAADMAAWDAKRGGLTDKIRTETKSCKPTAPLEAELRVLEQSKPEQPRGPRLIYSDATPEALAYSLGRQWPSGGVVSSEAGIVFGSHGMSSESVMRNLAMLNQLWDGAALRIDRRTSDSYSVRGARLTVALQVQAATLEAFFEKSGDLARGTGFLARFLIAWPASTQGYRLFREAPADWPNMAAFNRRIAELLRAPIPIDESGALDPPLLELSPEAKAAWIEYHNAIEVQLRDSGDLADVRDVASKSADNAARMAALFHVFSGAAGPIGVDAFDSASSIVAWHLSESKRFFAGMAVPEVERDAARLDAWLIERCRAEHTPEIDKSRAMQYGPLRKADPLSVALRTLEDRERVRVVKRGRKTVIHVNPALLTGSMQ
ncbi:YfjI family protein [Paraburkholderia sp. J11-2]|uniref:YfjI family protein n=1 Tax=Paraburkholderia sp. J11-2 TaxID=2805431 RepID=UPI002AB67F8B|nr:YfjI family protein [Paraburkholderia sp. J11-2]